MAASREALIVFAKFPRPGEVKTRLAASVGNVQAAAFYKHCAEAVIGELASLASTTLYVFFSRGDDEAEVAAWLAPLELANMRLVPQLQEPNLGARMQHALQYALNCGHQRVAIVGTDVPDLSSTVVASALHCLDTYQAVFGPAEDGGYYLLALNTLPSGLFQVAALPCWDVVCSVMPIHSLVADTFGGYLVCRSGLLAGHFLEHVISVGRQCGQRAEAGLESGPIVDSGGFVRH